MSDDLLYPNSRSTQYVINPRLYQNLNSGFHGEVIIANQGEQMQMSAAVTFDGRANTRISHSGEYYRVNCPFCRDTRQRLWVNHMYGQPDAVGKPMRFLAKCYNEDCLSDSENWEAFDKAVYGFVNANQRREMQFELHIPATYEDSRSLTVVEPPGQLIPLSQLAMATPDHPAVRYMCEQRRYSNHDLDHYQVSYCTAVSNPRYNTALNRIIFPIKHGGQLVGWQAREVPAEYGFPRSARGPKYWGMPGMKKRLMLYNADNARGKQCLVVVEGATDVHRVGDNSVAILGKSMSQQQFSMIVNDWGSGPIILIFDPDAREEMRGALTNFQNNRCIVVEILLPDGYDCSDYDRTSIWNIIRSQAEARGVILQQ